MAIYLVTHTFDIVMAVFDIGQNVVSGAAGVIHGKALTYELTHAFISAVYIYDLDNIEIVWKFKDFLTTSEGEAK